MRELIHGLLLAVLCIFGDGFHNEDGVALWCFGLGKGAAMEVGVSQIVSLLASVTAMMVVPDNTSSQRKDIVPFFK